MYDDDVRGALLSIVALVTGCDVVFGLGGRTEDAAIPDAPLVDADAAPPEACAFGAPIMVRFPASVEPMHDYADFGEHAFVNGFVTDATTVPRNTALVEVQGGWSRDDTSRDLVAGYNQVRPDPDATQMYGVVTSGVTTLLARFQLHGSGWNEVDMKPIDDRERVGNYREIDGKRVYVMTQKPVPGDPTTRLMLRVRDGDAWNEEDRMGAINLEYIPDLGALTLDGLTLIYSARKRTESQFDLYMSVRATTHDNFPIGTRLDELSLESESEVEPWIAGPCNRLSFRRGPSFFDGAAQVSTIYVTQ